VPQAAAEARLPPAESEHQLPVAQHVDAIVYAEFDDGRRETRNFFTR